MERLTLHEIAIAAGGTLASPADRGVLCAGVSIDSRTIRAGEVFWAVPGTRCDGHDFIEHAFARGAAAAVVRSVPVDRGGPLISVADPVVSLASFATRYRALLDAFVVGITGSVGKTTTRELIFAALGGGPTAVRSPRNYNNLLGLPLSLFEIERQHRFAVVELGAARRGEIAELASIARPEAGVITHLGVAHVETFGSEEEIVLGKGELVEALPADGFVVLPGDLPAARRIADRALCTRVFVGKSAANDHRVELLGRSAGELRFSVDGAAFQVAAAGSHVADLAAMAVVVARRLGRTDRQIATGLRNFESVAGRGRVATRSPWTVIDDSYNANPDSMRAAVEALAAWPTTGRRILVCGDMYGLGARTGSAHEELGALAAARGVDLVAAIGNYARQVAHGSCQMGMDTRRLACFEERSGAEAWLLEALQPGDVVWVKASRPLELERLVETLQRAARLAAGGTLRRAA